MKAPNEITIQVTIANGTFGGNTTTLKEILKAYNGMTVDLTFKRRINKRSVRQNAYYWSVIIPIWRNIVKEEWGELWDNQQMHEFLRDSLNYEEKIAPATGEVVRVAKSTTMNTTLQQEEYHKKCRDLAKEYFNIDIPLPNEEMELKFE